MSIFDDVSRFFEERLDDFLKQNPHLELEAIQEQLKQQEKDSQKLILEFEIQQKTLEKKILSIAEDIKNWHSRVEKAKATGRLDLAKAAQEREASLFREGNQLWGQMEGTKKRILQAKELLNQIKKRQQEVATQAAKAKYQSQTSQDSATTGWNKSRNSPSFNRGFDSLEQEFQRLETDEELERMKRNLNR